MAEATPPGPARESAQKPDSAPVYSQKLPCLLAGQPAEGRAVLMSETAHTDCRDPEGITIGLIEDMIATARILARRYLCAPTVVAALKDLANDPDVRLVMAYADMTALDQVYARMDAQSRTMDSLLDDADRTITALTELESRSADQEAKNGLQEARIFDLEGLVTDQRSNINRLSRELRDLGQRLADLEQRQQAPNQVR